MIANALTAFSLVIFLGLSSHAQTIEDGVRVDSLVDMSSNKASAKSLIGVSAPKPSPAPFDDNTKGRLEQNVQTYGASSVLSEILAIEYTSPERIPEIVEFWNRLDVKYGLTQKLQAPDEICTLLPNAGQVGLFTSEDAIFDVTASFIKFLPMIGLNADAQVCGAEGEVATSLGANLLWWARNLRNNRPLSEDQLIRSGLNKYVNEFNNVFGSTFAVAQEPTPENFSSKPVDPLEIPATPTCAWFDRDSDSELTKSRKGRSVQKGLYECGCNPETRGLSALALKKQSAQVISDYLRDTKRPVFTALLFQSILQQSSCRQYFFLWDDNGLALMRQNIGKPPLIKWMLETIKDLEIRNAR